MTKKKRAVGYIRVSTPAQATEDKVSLGEQRKDIEAYCERMGYEIVGWYSDIGSGASKRRPNFQRMLKDAQTGGFDVIVCWKSDRLSRGMYPAAALLEALEGTDINLDAVKDTIDLNTFGLLAAVGKIELDNIRERVRMGIRGKMSRGKVWGPPKFGYVTNVNGKPEIKISESEIVKRIFEHYITDRSPGLVAEGLNQENLLTVKGLPWTIAEISRVLKEPAYKGEAFQGKYVYTRQEHGDKVVTHRKLLPTSEWIQIGFPVIVDLETWERAQEIRKMNAHLSAPAGANFKFPLRGLVWCESCAGRFVPAGRAGYMRRYLRKDGSLYEKRSNTPFRRYKCIRSSKKRSNCARKSISARKLEDLVWQQVSSLLATPSSIREMVEIRRQEFEANGVDTNLAKAKRQLEAAEQERGRRLDQHAKGYIRDAELELMLRGLAERLEMYTEDVERLEKEARSYEHYVTSLDAFIRNTQNIRTRLNDMSQDERAEVIGLLVERIVIDPNSISITLVFDGVAQKSEATC